MEGLNISANESIDLSILIQDSATYEVLITHGGG